MQIRSNSENWSVVIRSIKIKDQLGAVFVYLLITNVFSCECTFEICKHCLMSACAWNEYTCFGRLFVIMNFVDASKKKINPNAKENEKIWVKMFSNFWTTGILKNWWSLLVILINTFFHFEIFWKPWCPEGTIFYLFFFKKKNWINILITPAQAIGHKTPDLETYFSDSLEIR